MVVMDGMLIVSVFLHFSVESGLVVRSVVDFTDGAVGFDQFIEAFHVVSFTCLVLTFYIVSMRVVDFVFECVVGRCLHRTRIHSVSHVILSRKIILYHLQLELQSLYHVTVTQNN